MIDLHAHILPGIDDGPSTLGEARDLLKAAATAGTTHIVATPHMNPAQFPNTQAGICQVFNATRVELEQASGIRLAVSAEVRVGLDTVELVERDEIPWLGEYDGQPVMLVEFPHTHLPTEAVNVVRWLVTRGIVPLIAHPERNREIMNNYKRLRELADLGCLFQLTAAAMVGGFGPIAQQVGRRMVEDKLVYALASDTHNTRFRPPALGPGGRVIEKMIGSSRVSDLVFDNPWRIVAPLFEAPAIDLVV